jgi:hypothetical protein
MIEIWKPVLGFEGFYEVSSLGRVRSIPRLGQRGKQKQRVYAGNVLRPVLKLGIGYLYVTLHGRELLEQRAVHRMVLESFVGPSPSGFHACHNNGAKTDNRLENLRWDDPGENVRDRARHGTVPLGERVHNAKLTSEEVRAIRASSERQAVLAARYGVTQVCISRIKLRKVWAHL